MSDVRADGLNKPAPSSIYWPFLKHDFGGRRLTIVQRTMSFAVRSPRAGSESLMKDLRQAVWSVNPGLPLANVRTVDDFVSRSMARTTLTLLALALSGGMALLLGTLGLYGVVAYSVSQRTREIGIRLALGAQHRQVTGLFLRHAVALVSIGIAVGFVASLSVGRVLSSLLFEVSPTDPLTYAAIAAVLFATSLLASYVPSRRAVLVSPIDVLKGE